MGEVMKVVKQWRAAERCLPHSAGSRVICGDCAGCLGKVGQAECWLYVSHQVGRRPREL